MARTTCRPAEKSKGKFREADLVESAETTQKIADEIEIELPLHQSLLPRYPLPPGTTPQAYLRRLCEEGLRQRITALMQRMKNDCAYELEVIHEMGLMITSLSFGM